MTTITQDVAGRVTDPTRGRLEIAERAVVKVARQVANEVAGAGGHSGGVLGIGGQADLSARPEVDVQLSGRTATLRVTVGLAYPAPLRQMTERIREHIVARVPALTGIDVHRVDIEVAWLVPGATRISGDLALTGRSDPSPRRRLA
ncbi:MAG: Asp23/Gls24 family envelope stress response protein [Propionibacteriales bacterium]|nr:Asp23/Gls24 family envelope stress response protein [Propionibacteriales bacterium]